jgi:crotonobetainyl-CoA:carnitine CoA-transferase CaiB-like acyl-CoA transferase
LATQALAGFLSVNDGTDGSPVVPGAPSADMAAGLTALSAVLMALIGRDKSGKGDFIDCAMFDSVLPWCVHTAGSAIAGGPSPVSSKQRSLGGAGFYQVYQTSDGKHVVLGGREIKFAENLLNALGRSDLIDHAKRDAGEQVELIAYLRSVFAKKARDEWVDWFKDKDVAFSPVLDFREALHEPHIAERGLWVEHDGAHHIAPAIRFASERWLPSNAPELNAGDDAGSVSDVDLD